MKTGDKVIITDGYRKGQTGIITGFEHLAYKAPEIVINNNPDDFSRVEIQSKSFNDSDLIKDNKLYFAVKDFKINN